ncbi:MAG: hypothetical protein MI861_18170, partial [Pirellulales bacterium]|nr:hypothetical protein [Pirellulales bacterium]
MRFIEGSGRDGSVIGVLDEATSPPAWDSSPRPILNLVLTAIALMLLNNCTATAADWTNWRGPERSGVSRETNLPDDLDNVLWKKDDVSCRSTPIVMDDKVYVVSRIGEDADEQERVVCMDAKTGDIIWEHRFGIFFTP